MRANFDFALLITRNYLHIAHTSQHGLKFLLSDGMHYNDILDDMD
jgi:hypothetical protein